jgi:hypothetical protein
VSQPGWANWLDERFPGYLFPASMHRAVDPEVARRFLTRLTGRADHLRLLEASAFFGGRVQELRHFTDRLLPEFIDRMPSFTQVHRRRWEGGFQGRLDVRATLAERLSGRMTTYVTRARRRSFDLPETELVRAVAASLRRELRRLQRAALLHREGWSAGLADAEVRLTHALERTVLREVAEVVPEARHHRAARSARMAVYGVAATWQVRLEEAFVRRTPERTAALLGRGALAPCHKDTRFELAVVLKLLEALTDGLRRRRGEVWALRHGLIVSGRQEVAWLDREDGAQISLWYNQAILPGEGRARGVKHYFGSAGRLRPDFSLRVRLPDGTERWCLGEVKLSSDPLYWRRGYSEAWLYRHEFGRHLTGWPKAILVCSGGDLGPPRLEDDVVAIGWSQWVPEPVIEGLLAGL